MEIDMTREEAIKELRGFIGQLTEGCQEAIKVLIPELAESEDERIRKMLIARVRTAEDLNEELREWIISYLEKQKERKPELPKPHKGDDTNPYDMSVSEAQEYAINRGFGIPFNDGEVYVDERYITQTIGNILRWADEHPKEQKPAEWSEEDERRYNQVVYLIEQYGGFQSESLYYQDKTIVEGGPKYILKSEVLDWFKSLKNRGNFPKSNTNSSCWKPSKEQIDALNDAIDYDRTVFRRMKLASLLEDLKKLM